MLLDGLKDARSRLTATADVRIVEAWITRVAGVQANLDAITDWEAAEAHEVNALHPGEALGRLFARRLDDGEFETELTRLEEALAKYVRELELEPPTLR